PAPRDVGRTARMIPVEVDGGGRFLAPARDFVPTYLETWESGRFSISTATALWSSQPATPIRLLTSSSYLLRLSPSRRDFLGREPVNRLAALVARAGFAGSSYLCPTGQNRAGSERQHAVDAGHVLEQERGQAAHLVDLGQELGALDAADRERRATG